MLYTINIFFVYILIFHFLQFLRISYLEIYNEKIFDLLARYSEPTDLGSVDKLVIVENSNGVYVRGLSYHLAQNEEESLNLLFEVCFNLLL